MTIRPHGYARYKLDNCRCNICGFAVSEYERNRQAAIAAGTWRVNANQLRAHVAELRAGGMGYKLIAVRARVSATTLQRIIYGANGRGPSKTTRRDVAERILAVRLALADNTPTDATGTIRRAQALVAAGYTITEVGHHVGWTAQNLSPLLTGTRPWDGVAVRTARSVSAAYDRLAMTQPAGPTADRARNLARKNGWFPTLAWDDDTIDDPTAVPCLTPPIDGSNPDVDELAVQHAVAGHPGDVDADVKAEVTWRLFAAGYQRNQIAALLGTTPAYVEHLRGRARRTAARYTATTLEGVAA